MSMQRQEDESVPRLDPHRYDPKPLEQIQRNPERVVGPAISLIIHILFLVIAAWIIVRPPAGPGDREVTIDFATLADESLADLADTGNQPADDAPLINDLVDVPSTTETLAVVDPTSSSSDTPDPGSLDALGGAGTGVDPGSTLGGGGGTSFFGISSAGRRFIYIVDVSGSMNSLNRIGTLQTNLVDSIAQLPVHVQFLVITYADSAHPFDDTYTWCKADQATKFRVTAWVKRLSAGGATHPEQGFKQAFEMRPRPDVIYFMTDGQDINNLAEFIASMNNKGRRTRINTIAFGERGSEEMMRRIAQESGGVYRYVPDGSEDGP